MSHPTCCCSVSLDRCDRCDLLVGLEGFHLMSAVRTPDALMLDIESCNRFAGCPGCGVAQGHGRVVVEVIDAPWAGVPVRIRWHKRRWICRERTCRIVTFIEQNHSVCAPRALLGTRTIRWAIRQLRFEGATILGLARQLGTTWYTVWSHIKPCLQAASDDPARFAGVRVLGVDEHVWHHQDRRRRGPRELTGIADHSREGPSHGPLIGPGPRKVWHRVQELAGQARKRLPRGSANRETRPLPGTARTPSLGLLQDATSVLDAFHIVKLAGDAPGEVRRRIQQDTTGHRRRTGEPLYQIRNLLRASRDRLTNRQQERLRAAFTADEAHISVEVAYHCAQQVRDVFHQATPAQGRRLATHLIERLPTCPIPDIARLGRTLRKWKDALDAYFDTGGASNAPHRSHQRNHRTRQTHRQRPPKPHQLPTPNAPHRRRPRRLHPHPTLKSRKTGADQLPNDWYEYVEYGTDNPITIGLQRLGFSRESAAYLRTHADCGYYTVNDTNQVFLNPRILNCDNPEVRMEAKEIQYNVPEFMLPAE